MTFGFAKCGLCLYPGRIYAGELCVANAGFADVRTIPEIWEQAAFTMEDTDIAAFFDRPADTNKGSYGKLLIVAGSENMAGAAALSARAAYRTGCGLVKVFTHENNRTVVLTHVPEAVMVTYKDTADIKAKLQGSWTGQTAWWQDRGFPNQIRQKFTIYLATRDTRKKASGASGCRRIKHHC